MYKNWMIPVTMMKIRNESTILMNSGVLREYDDNNLLTTKSLFLGSFLLFMRSNKKVVQRRLRFKHRESKLDGQILLAFLNQNGFQVTYLPKYQRVMLRR